MPLTADDRLAILDVLARANWAADAKDVEELADHYAPDGQISGAFQAQAGDGFRGDLRRIFDGEGSLKRHLLANPVIEGDGDRAQVTWLMPVFEGETEPALVATCKVTDELRRENGRWLIVHHRVEIDPSMTIDVGQGG
ncbi:MAG: nuclear transport factor 2 family protein [Methylobacteriaceae bacterium]|nr:nuclear transport factor 2 family protein [Methylobacteriaceae bacterium]